MQRYIERIRRRLHFVPRILASAMGALVLAACLFALIPALTVSAQSTSEADVQLRLLAAQPMPEEGFVGPSADEAPRLFQIGLVDGGQAHLAEVQMGDTVGDLLEQLDIELEGEDYVMPTSDVALDASMDCPVVYRVHYVEEQRREQLSDEDLLPYMKGLTEEETAAFVRGYNNTYDVSYRDRYVNGEVRHSQILELVPVPVPTGNRAELHNDFSGVEIGPDGVPTSYAWLMDGAVTTAYSSSGGRGASGLGLYHGTVAVNPNVIPYGTRLYITSADGSYVYGFAIATDTGIALMDGRVDIDLYFGSNAECLAFGKRAMQVYVLG